MKKLIIALVLLLIALGATIWYLKFAGVTHEDLYAAVTDEAGKTQAVVDDRYQRLDCRLERIEQKFDDRLERIEHKLDRILELANRPLPDGMQKLD